MLEDADIFLVTSGVAIAIILCLIGFFAWAEKHPDKAPEWIRHQQGIFRCPSCGAKARVRKGLWKCPLCGNSGKFKK